MTHVDSACEPQIKESRLRVIKARFKGAEGHGLQQL